MENKTFDPMAAPLSEVLDWLAEKDGWRQPKPGDKDFLFTGQVMGVWVHPCRRSVYTHPITLDRLAWMLDDTVGVSLYKLPRVGVCDARWTAHAWSRGLFNISTPDRKCPTAIESLARVVAAVLMRAQPWN